MILSIEQIKKGTSLITIGKEIEYDIGKSTVKWHWKNKDKLKSYGNFPVSKSRKIMYPAKDNELDQALNLRFE